MFNYDYFSAPRTDIAAPGNTLLLLGTSINGPVNEPIRVASPAEAELYFGTEGTLIAGYRQAHAANPQADCYLMRATGQHARAVLWALDEDMVFAGLRLRAVAGGQRYNAVAAEVRVVYGEPNTVGDHALVVYPARPELAPRAYKLDDHPLLGLLVKAINEDAMAGLVEVNASTDETMAPSNSLVGFNSETVYLEDGDDGLAPTKNELYAALEQSYRLLEGRPLDVVVPLGAAFDDTAAPTYYGEAVYGQAPLVAEGDYLSAARPDGSPATFHGQLIAFCRSQQKFGMLTHGVLGMRPLPDQVFTGRLGFSYIRHLLASTALADRHGLTEGPSGQPDLGYCISVVANDLSFNDEHPASWAAAYGAHILACGLENTANVPIRGATGQRLVFGDQELRLMARLGVVAPRYSVRHRQLVVSAGVTLALRASPLHHLTNVRTAQYALFRLREVLDRFLGDTRPNLGLQGMIEEAVEQCFAGLASAGILDRYDFKFQIEPYLWQGGRWGRLNLTLGTRYSIEDISTSVTFPLSGT